MKRTIVALSLGALASAQGAGVVMATTATGPYKAGAWSEASLPKHTIFGPVNPPAGLKIPVMVWGNGACSSNGMLFQKSLFEAASHGFLVLANGPQSGGAGQTNAHMQTESMDWLDKNAGQGKYAHVDKSRLASAGQSCGGLEAYVAGADKRVSTIGIFNSGEFTAAKGKDTAKKVAGKPIFYFLGGSSDIAYENVSFGMGSSLQADDDIGRAGLYFHHGPKVEGEPAR
jgi:hypothetical protein